MKLSLSLFFATIAVCYFQTNGMLMKNPNTGKYLTYEEAYKLKKVKCSENCRDEKIVCGMPRIKNWCGHFFLGAQISVTCPKTCNTCIPCQISQRPCGKADQCKDELASCKYLAPRMCNVKLSGYFVNYKCQKSCLACTPCKAALPPPPCEEACQDYETGCGYWANDMNYCEESIYSSWMAKKCRRSCKLCRKCKSSYGGEEQKPVKDKPTSKPDTGSNGGSASTSGSSSSVNSGKCVRGKTQGVSVKEQCLNTHNYYRCLHGVAPLKYDFSLERGAQLYANRLPLMNEIQVSKIGFDRSRRIGENIAWRFDATSGPRYSINDAVVDWYAQSLGYEYTSEEVLPESEFFTQMIWKDTTKVGCALKKYKEETYVVARYGDTGNVPDQFFDNVPQPESVCDSKCGDHWCQGNSGDSFDCGCDTSKSPMCHGRCVVKCQRPDDHFDDWIDSCEGSNMCTCSNEQDHRRGVPHGAYCK